MQLLGRLVVRLPFQIAQDQRCTIFPRQPAQLLIEHGPDLREIRGSRVRQRFRRLATASSRPRRRIVLLLALVATRKATPYSQFDNRPRSRIAGALRTKHQERRLEGIFDVARIAQDPPAHGPAPWDRAD